MNQNIMEDRRRTATSCRSTSPSRAKKGIFSGANSAAAALGSSLSSVRRSIVRYNPTNRVNVLSRKTLFEGTYDASRWEYGGRS